ncbi:MAG: slipin family protein [Bacteroidota bacterium]
MKRIRIFAHTVGLVFRKNHFIGVIKEGAHWLRFWDTVKVYHLAKPFVTPCELNILLQDQDFVDLIDLIEVRDNELVLQYLEGNFHQVLTPGRYAFWKGLINYGYQYLNLDEVEIGPEVDRRLLQRSALMNHVRAYTIESYEKGLLYIDGHLIRQLGAGVYHFWRADRVAQVVKTDMRRRQIEISGQEILTKDKAAVRVNFYTYWRVADIEKALDQIQDFTKQLYVSVQLALREYIGTLTLDELLARKEEVEPFIRERVATKAEILGIEVLGGGIRDIILPGEVKEIMNQVLVAQKTAQANIITRREETASTRSLLNTAKLMEDNEMLFKLKEMEYVEKIADKISNISLSGSSQIVDQLRQIFVSDKK